MSRLEVARLCRHMRRTCRSCGTMTERRRQLATFGQPWNGSVAVNVSKRLAGLILRSGIRYVFAYQRADPNEDHPATDALKALDGLTLGTTLTAAKDAVLAYRAGRLGHEWAIPPYMRHRGTGHGTAAKETAC